MADLHAHAPAAPPRRPAPSDDALTPVRRWIEQNETLAVLAGFATGVFIGALMRR